MGMLDGKVVIVTGGGRGIGRDFSLAMAANGASVVVNDLGSSTTGEGADAGPAQQVVDEIRAAGGKAVASTDSVATWESANKIVNTAVEAFGRLDVVVNNAGILRDRVLVNMTEEEWDAVIAVHLKGHFAPTRWAAAYWREQHKAGVVKPRNLVHTSSTSGLFANPGQSNYGAAKTGIATFSQIAAKELARYGVKSNTIAPGARTRLTLATPGLEDIMNPKDGVFDQWDPANISPLVAYLASEACAFTGETFLVQGGNVTMIESWARGQGVDRDSRWTVSELADAMLPLARS